MSMTDNDNLPRRGADADQAVTGPDRLAWYEASSREPLDLLALATLWLVVVPWWDFGHGVKDLVLGLRVALSVVYGVDIAIRSSLAQRTCTMRSAIRLLWPRSSSRRCASSSASAWSSPCSGAGTWDGSW